MNQQTAHMLEQPSPTVLPDSTLTGASNQLGQRLGLPLPAWRGCPFPIPVLRQGRYSRLEPLDLGQHGRALYAAQAVDQTGASWTYLPYGPFASYAAYVNKLQEVNGRGDPQLYTVLDASGQPQGILGLMRIDPPNGVIEVGHVYFAPALQRTQAATEALALLLERVFQLGYRRCEWKCNALNQASRQAALRLGFSYEGTFRQAAVIKGHSRDTAWFAMLDQEWPLVRQALWHWLDAANFAGSGQQRRSLKAWREDLATQPSSATELSAPPYIFQPSV